MKDSIRFNLFAVLMLASTSSYSSVFLDDYELVFSDEFSSNTLDSSKWSTRHLWGSFRPINGEEQYYVDSLDFDSDFAFTPFELTGDSLIIRAQEITSQLPAPDQPPETSSFWSANDDFQFNPDYLPEERDYFSGIISSYENFNFTHGYVESRAKLPKGQGLWSALWLLTSKYVEDVPEIDIVEALGHDVNELNHTLHYFDTDNGWQLVSSPTYKSTVDDYSNSFHTYGLKWEPRKITWYVDGIAVKEVTDSDFKIAKQSMYLIANLAVGGTWPGSPDATTVFPAEYEIDYIRAYKRKPVPVITPQTLQSDYQLMFSDEFDGSTLDFTKWNTSFLWGPYFPINSEQQIYIDRAGRHSDHSINPFDVSNGTLKITAEQLQVADVPVQPDINDPEWQLYESHQYNNEYGQTDGWTPDYSSGLITSYDKFKFVNGYVEARIKVPEGSGAWPAFWLLNGYYVGNLPEIDIMELRGSDPNTVHHSYHYFNTNGELQSSAETTSLSAGKYSDDFHTYAVQWDRGQVTWYLDGSIVRVMQGPETSTQLMYILLNLAIGGNFVESVLPGTIPATMEIDYVRAYQRNSLDIEILDEIAPSVVIATPTDNVLLPDQLLTGTANDTGGSGIDSVFVFVRDMATRQFVALDGSGDGTWASYPATVSSNTGDGADWSIAHELPVGEYRIWVYALDAHGNADRWSTSVLVNVGQTDDSIAPELTFASPNSNGATVVTGQTIVGTVEDDGGSGIEEVRVFVRNLSNGDYVALDGSGDGSWQSFEALLSSPDGVSGTWSIEQSLPTGSYRLFVYGVDNSGNLNKWSTSLRVNVILSLDDISPTVSFSNPSVGDTDLALGANISGSIEDVGGSGINEVRVFVRDLSTGDFVSLDGSGDGSWASFPAQLINAGDSEAEWFVSQALPIGSYRLHAYGVDNQGNFDKWSTSVRVNVVSSDDIAPTIVFNDPAVNGGTAANTFSGEVLDDGGSGIGEARVFIRNLVTGEYVAPDGSGDGSWQSFPAQLINVEVDFANWSISHSLPPGTYRVNAYGVDNNGNFDKWSTSILFNPALADNIAPSIVFTNPSTNGDPLPAGPLTGQVLDEGGAGIKEVRVFVRDLSTGNYVSLDGSGDGSWNSFPAVLTNETTSSADWSIAHSLPDGNYRIMAYGVDNSNNLEKWSYSVRVQ